MELSKEILFLLSREIEDLILILNSRLEIEYINEKSFLKQLGYLNEDLIKKNFKDFVTEKDFSKISRLIEEKIQKKAELIDIQIYHKDGNKKWFEVKCTLIDYSKGDINFLLIARDISEKKFNELTLKDSKEKYQSIIENIKEGYYEVDLKGNFMFVNEALCKFLGYTQTELLQENYDIVTEEKARKVVYKTFNKVFTTEIRQNIFQFPIIRKNGERGFFETSVYLKYDSKGKKNGFYGIVRDITERKKEEDLEEKFKIELTQKVRISTKELEESQEKYRNLFQQSNDGIFLHDLEGNIIDANQKVIDYFGYTKEEILALNIAQLHPISELVESKRAFEEVSKKGFVTFEINFKKKNGDIFPAEVSSSLFTIGEETFIQGEVRDITIRKQAEQKLVESEEKYRLISETAYDLIGVLNKKFKYEYINENAFQQILGYTSKDILGNSVLKFIHSEDVSNIAKTLLEGFKSGVGGGELRFRHKNGHWVWIEAKGKTFYDVDNEVKALIISRDITEKKRAADKLRESEEKYRNMINNLDLGFYQVSWEGDLLNYNPAFSKLLGFDPKEEPLEINVLQFWQNPDERENYLKLLEDKGFVKNFIVQSRKKDGHNIVLNLNSHLITSNPPMIQGVISDITEKFELEQKVKESEIRYRNLFESVPFAISLIDQKGKIIYCNPAVEPLLGYSLGELIGKEFRYLIAIQPEFLPMMLKRFEKLLEGEKLPPFDAQFKKKNGDLVWLNYQTTLVKFGKDFLVQAILHDVSERKRADLLVQEEIQKLKELDQIRKDLISRVSHELKTPLVSVCGASELLLDLFDEKISEDGIELIKMIEKGGSRLKYLVDNLLDITRIEYSKLKLVPELTNLSELLKDCSKELMYLITQRKLNLKLEVPDEVIINIDKIRIEHVILNLLSNAIKNTNPNGTVSIHLYKNENWVEVSVNDTGIGLTREEMDRLFTRFGKIERYGEDLEFIDIQGSGLGLYISKEIVDLHNGQIWAESPGRNKGSTFRVKLPIIE
jgi:PAS domain S-box-containing protein